MVNRKYSAYMDAGLGSITVGETDTIVAMPNRTVKFPTRYVDSFSIGEKQPLGKIKVTMSYYDLLASRETLVFSMSENEAIALKRAFGK